MAILDLMLLLDHHCHLVPARPKVPGRLPNRKRILSMDYNYLHQIHSQDVKY